MQSWIKQQNRLDVEVEWGMVGEADKRRGGEREREGECICSQPLSL